MSDDICITQPIKTNIGTNSKEQKYLRSVKCGEKRCTKRSMLAVIVIVFVHDFLAEYV